MKLHEAWRAQYRTSRYLEHLAEEEAQQRAKDLFVNMLIITDQTKIGLPPFNEELAYWMELWTHLLEEFVLRFGPYPAGFDSGFMSSVSIPRPSNPLAETAATAVSRRAIPKGTYLAKYGKLEHLKPAYERGCLRIAPASSYSDPSLNPAIRDEELEIEIQPPSANLRLDLFDGKTGQSKGRIHPIGNRIKWISQTNYYVSCFSSAFVPRLFLDFDDAEACLLIVRPREFIEILFAEFERLFPEFAGIENPVRYIDPVRTHMSDLDIFFCKHFRYAYQKEFRFVWLPPTACKKLEPVYLELGDLSSYAELITLAGA